MLCLTLGSIWHFIVMMGGFYFMLMIMRPRLVCPGCSNTIDHEYDFGRYYPECGAPSLQLGNWFHSPRCDLCGKSMKLAKGRKYKNEPAHIVA